MTPTPAGDRERWNARYRDASDPPNSAPWQQDRHWPAAFHRLTRSVDLPAHGVAVDLAGGAGAGAIGFAKLGYHAVVLDVSDVALGLARDRAAKIPVALETIRYDLAGRTLGQVLSVVGPVIMVSCVHYLNRGVLRSVFGELTPGAVFMASIATTTNLERHERPSERFLLEPGELRALVVDRSAAGDGDGRRLEVLHDSEGWNESGSHEAELVVRSPPRST